MNEAPTRTAAVDPPAGAALPVEVTSFVGRRRELADVRRMLTGGTRLLTLIGVGGVGKTRLALRAAVELRRNFADGVVLVELAELRDGDELAERVASALRIPSAPRETLWPALRRHLLGKRVLLVMDNCEHLLEASARLAGTLLATTPHVRVLATSRQPLGIPGEHIVAVPTLAVPDSANAVELSTVDQYDAVTLFAERAKAVQAEFALTEPNCAQVARLCKHLDGIPLAIEFAAARLRAFSLRQLLDRVGDRYRLLTAGNRIALPRQQTLRALVDWSFGLCTPGEQALWARLSVFAGRFDLAAAEAVCAGEGIAADDVPGLLGTLVDKSVVVRDDTARGADYELLETIRQYGHDRLVDRGELSALRRKHLAWFAERARLGTDQIEWYEVARADTENLRIALDRCLDQPGEHDTAVDLAVELAGRLSSRGLFTEARPCLDRVVAAVREPGPARVRALAARTWLTLRQGDRAAAAESLAECRAAAERTGDHAALRHAVDGLGKLFDADFDAAIPLLRKASDPGLGDHERTPAARDQLTVALCLAGHPDAPAHLAEALATTDEHTTPVSRAHVLWCAAVERFTAGAAAESLPLVTEALRLAAGLGDRWLVAACVEVCAWAAAALGNAGRAARLLGAAEALRQAMGCDLAGQRHLRGPHDRCVETVRGCLGPQTYLAATRLGAGLGERQAVDYAREVDRPSARPAPATPDPLTPRERQIADLVAKGLSNKEIAATLTIAQRTAETHVERILTKLGFNRRTQIAAWATERRAAIA